MTREEWIRRFADRVKAMSEISEEEAMESAKSCADTAEDDEWLDPEEAADTEMSYWDDDGG